MKLLQTIALIGVFLPGVATADELSTEAVRDAVAAEARINLPDTVVGIEVHDVQLRGSLDIPAGAAVQLRILADGDEDWIGKFSGIAEASSQGKTLGRLRIIAQVVARIELPVLRNPVVRGQRIQPEDLTMTRRAVDKLPSGLITSSKALIGRIARRNLTLNQLVTNNDLTERADAGRNHPVTLLVHTGSLTVTAPGVLKADSQVGDLVEVFSTSTRSSVFGILRSPDLVEVPTVTSVRNSAFRQSGDEG